jgi:hypothetical protein
MIFILLNTKHIIVDKPFSVSIQFTDECNSDGDYVQPVPCSALRQRQAMCGACHHPQRLRPFLPRYDYAVLGKIRNSPPWPGMVCATIALSAHNANDSSDRGSVLCPL